MSKPAKLASLMADGWALDDGVQLHKAHPKTFWIPSSIRRHLIRPKQIVKLVFRIALQDEAGTQTEEVERMWVIVERRLRLGVYEGVLDNDPVCTEGIKSGMKVFFEAKHIIQIHADEA